MIIPELLDFVSIVDWHVEVETVNNSPLSESKHTLLPRVCNTCLF